MFQHNSDSTQSANEIIAQLTARLDAEIKARHEAEVRAKLAEVQNPFAPKTQTIANQKREPRVTILEGGTQRVDF
ncbi:MAG: hypothetical protein AB7T49_21485 [Oligoflexales bacterium]